MLLRPRNCRPILLQSWPLSAFLYFPLISSDALSLSSFLPNLTPFHHPFLLSLNLSFLSYQSLTFLFVPIPLFPSSTAFYPFSIVILALHPFSNYPSLSVPFPRGSLFPSAPRFNPFLTPSVTSLPHPSFSLLPFPFQPFKVLYSYPLPLPVIFPSLFRTFLNLYLVFQDLPLLASSNFLTRDGITNFHHVASAIRCVSRSNLSCHPFIPLLVRSWFFIWRVIHFPHFVQFPVTFLSISISIVVLFLFDTLLFCSGCFVLPGFLVVSYGRVWLIVWTCKDLHISIGQYFSKLYRDK